MKIKNIHIFGGGTVAHITSHFAVCAPAYGKTAETLGELCSERFNNCNIHLELTKMGGIGFDDTSGGQWPMETNEDVQKRVEELKENPNTKVIFFNCALVDWEPQSLEKYFYTDCKHIDRGTNTREFGKYVDRLETRKTAGVSISLSPANKIIPSIRTGRKDIFLVGFKTTCGASKQEMFEKGLRLCKEGSVNLVLVNDVKTRWNMIVTPEEAAYHETSDRAEALYNLVDMAYLRSHLTFTQSTVIAGDTVKWNDPRVPSSLRTVVDHCVNGNAYKVFNGGTVGHFAVKLSDTEFLTSIRKSNFNDLDKVGLVYVKTDGPDTVVAYGAKPSVGGQSQRIVFREHEGMDAIVHFHCPLRPDHPDDIPVRSQREVECGSHQCGQNTSSGLKQFGNLKAVMLDQHGPNIVFNKNIDPQEVIDFIERNFDLSKKTGGYTI
jgi:hypothetical protein